MKITKPIDFQRVEELSHLLRATRISQGRFSLEIPERDCANGLYASFKSEVEHWGGTLMFDDDTRRHIFDAARWLANAAASPGLMLCGLYGNGKTTLAQAIKKLVESLSRIELGYTNRKRMPLLTAKEVSALMKSDRKSYDGLLTEELLIIDDLGEEPTEIVVFGSTETPVADLLAARYARRLFTVCTTNLTADDLKTKYGPRIYDRLAEMMTLIVFENPSYRTA